MVRRNASHQHRQTRPAGQRLRPAAKWRHSHPGNSDDVQRAKVQFRLFSLSPVIMKSENMRSAKSLAALSSVAARPGEKATLTSRLIDRPLRPLFPYGMRNETQVIAMPLSYQPEFSPGCSGRHSGKRRPDGFRHSVPMAPLAASASDWTPEASLSSTPRFPEQQESPSGFDRRRH